MGGSSKSLQGWGAGMHEQMEMAPMEVGPPGSGGGQVSRPGLPATSEQVSVPHPQNGSCKLSSKRESF